MESTEQSFNYNPTINNLEKFVPEIQKRKLSIPLHIKNDDWSGEACLKRFDLWMTSRTINPQGFRRLRTSKHQLIKDPFTRFSWITKIASEFMEEQKKEQQPQGNLSFSTEVNEQ